MRVLLKDFLINSCFSKNCLGLTKDKMEWGHVDDLAWMLSEELVSNSILIPSLKGGKILVSRGWRHCVVWGGRVNMRVFCSTTSSRSSNTLWLEWLSNNSRTGLSWPQFGINTCLNHSTPSELSVQPSIWWVNLVLGDPRKVANFVSDTSVFPLTINKGGIASPPAEL